MKQHRIIGGILILGGAVFALANLGVLSEFGITTLSGAESVILPIALDIGLIVGGIYLYRGKLM